METRSNGIAKKQSERIIQKEMCGIPVGDFHRFPFRFEGVARKQTVRPRHPAGISGGR